VNKITKLKSLEKHFPAIEHCLHTKSDIPKVTQIQHEVNVKKKENKHSKLRQ